LVGAVPSGSTRVITAGLPVFVDADGTPTVQDAESETDGGQDDGEEVGDQESQEAESEDEELAEETEECSDEDRLEWLRRGPRTAARDLDWGRRSGIGANPESAGSIFQSDGCYFPDDSGVVSAGP
jgi:hypothetical protein